VVQRTKGAEVHIATVGETSVEPVMRKALAIGADKAFRVDTHPIDGFLVAQALSEQVKKKITI
jgi:electron transfer flavoprotein beta subunit